MIVCGICRVVDKKQISKWQNWPKKAQKCCTKIKLAIICAGVAEELCRLFPCDDNVEMTPILRKSKDSARRQRLKPPSSESASSSAAAASAARRGPVSRGRPYHGGPPPHHHRGGGGAHDRKRRSDSDSYYSRPPPPKYSRSSYHDPDPRYTSSRKCHIVCQTTIKL